MALTEAIRLLGVYTGGSFDVWALAGPARASSRAHVMSELLGVKAPQAKSGVNAIARLAASVRPNVTTTCEPTAVACRKRSSYRGQYDPISD